MLFDLFLRNNRNIYNQVQSGAQEHVLLASYILENAHTSLDQKLNLSKLNDAINKGFNTTFEDFKKQMHHPDHWFITVEDLKNKKWKNASALVESNKVLKHGFFKGKRVPVESITLVDGVKCIRWAKLLENPDLTYLDSRYTVRDYAKDRRKIILGLRDKNLKANTTTHFSLPDGTQIWAARTIIDNKDTIIFSTFSNFDCGNVWC